MIIVGYQILAVRLAGNINKYSRCPLWSFPDEKRLFFYCVTSVGLTIRSTLHSVNQGNNFKKVIIVRYHAFVWVCIWAMFFGRACVAFLKDELALIQQMRLGMVFIWTVYDSWMCLFLAQNITLNYHLLPWSLMEDYVFQKGHLGGVHKTLIFW